MVGFSVSRLCTDRTSATTTLDGPTGVFEIARQRSATRASGWYGSPVSSVDQPCSLVNLSDPLTANDIARSSWIESIRCTTKVSASRIPPALPVALVTENTRATGSMLTEATLDAVNPTGPSGVWAVITAIPAGWYLNASLNCSAISIPSKVIL